MTDGPRLDDQLCSALYAAPHSVLRAYGPGLAEIGLTYPEYLVMMVLWEADGASIQQLGDRLQQAPHGLTSVLRRLVEAGLVSRTSDPVDARVAQFHMTSAGRGLARAASATQADVACRTGLDPTKYATLRATLQRLTRATADSGPQGQGVATAGGVSSSVAVEAGGR